MVSASTNGVVDKSGCTIGSGRLHALHAAQVQRLHMAMVHALEQEGLPPEHATTLALLRLTVTS